MDNLITEVEQNQKSFSKEQEEFVKEKLTEWRKRKSQNTVTRDKTIEDFGKQIEILDIKSTSLIKVELKTRFVQRQFKYNLAMPFNGQDIPDEIQEPNDIWSYDTEGSNYNDKDDKYISENEFNEIQKSLSKKMDETFYWMDDSIGNLSRKDIESIEKYRLHFFEDNCSEYPLQSTYKLSVCPECAGSGKIPCYYCDGSGRVLSDNKRVYCPHCKGAKNTICSTCEGKKKAIKYTALAEHFTVKRDSTFINNNIPEPFFTGLQNMNGFIESEKIEINSDNNKEVFDNNKVLKNNQEIFEKTLKMIKDANEQVDYYNKVDKFEIILYELKTDVIKYKYQNQEYYVVLYGDEHTVYAPVDTYPLNIKKSNSGELEEGKIDKKGLGISLILLVIVILVSIFGLKE